LPHECCSTLRDSATLPCFDRRKTTLLANERGVRHDLLTTLLANERASCSEWRCSIRPEFQGEGLGQCFICICLCIGLTVSSGPIVLTVPQKLIPGRSRRKTPPPPLAICNNWAAADLSAEILGMNPTWAELSVCARAQVAVRHEVNGRGRYRLLSHNMVLLNAQPAADPLPT